MDQQEIGALKAELRQFTGSEQLFYNPLFPRCRYTEGVRHLAEQAGAYWLLDHIFAHQSLAILEDQPFQVWKITVRDDESARIEVEDGNRHSLKSFRIPYTDFPFPEFTLWCVDGVLLLPSEY